MILTYLTLAFALVATVLPLMKLEYPALSGVVCASGANERWSVKILVPILTVAALAVLMLGLLPAAEQPDWGVTLDLHAVAIISLGAAASVIVAAAIHRFTSVPYALAGALFGYQFMTEGGVDVSLVGGIALSWVAAPVLCGLLSALIARMLLRYATRPGRNLVIIDQRLLAGCILGTLLLTVTAAWNLGQFVGFFPGALLGEGVVPFAITLVAVGLLFLMRTRISEGDTDFGSVTTLAILLSMAVCFGLFSWNGIREIGLVPTTLSASSLLVAGLVGVSVAMQNPMISGEDVLKSAAASFVAPVLGFLLAYCLSMVFSTLILLGLVSMTAALYLYVRKQRSDSRRREMIRDREEQIYSTQKSLSALEVRVETHEKELLNKLDNKRKELVDFAVGVSEQKAFMEKVYEDLVKVRALPDGHNKEKALDEVLSHIRERMYFTREMNDFYARTEVLHRDFNMRLKEAFPDLTENERKLANLLRQGFSSKYIASLMNITPKSVEISRYRLRTKLGLKRSDNLVQYIKSL